MVRNGQGGGFRTSYYVCVGKNIDKNLRQMRYTHQQEFTFHEDTCWTQLYGIFQIIVADLKFDFLCLQKET